MRIIFIVLLTIIVSILVCLLMIRLPSMIKRNLRNMLKKNEKGYFSYSRIEEYIKKKGNLLNLNPVTFIGFKIISTIFFFVMGLDMHWIVHLVFSTLGFFLLDIAIEISDKQDNKKIIIDLSNIYDCIRIQTKAGVFITTALAECFLLAKNKRMKKALIELSSELILKNNLETAIDNFNSKFDCNHIDSFCITIKQSAVSGKNSELLKDFTRQIKETNNVLEIQAEEKEKREVMLIQILIFIGIVSILMFGLFLELSRNIRMF